MITLHPKPLQPHPRLISLPTSPCKYLIVVQIFVIEICSTCDSKYLIVVQIFIVELCSTYDSYVRLNIVDRHGYNYNRFRLQRNQRPFLERKLPSTNSMVVNPMSATILHFNAPLLRTKPVDSSSPSFFYWVTSPSKFRNLEIIRSD